MRPLLCLIALALPISLVQAAPAFTPTFARPRQEPRLLPCALPDYPKASRRNEETGRTTIRYAVSADGKVSGLAVIKSSGFRDLDKAAIAAMGKCHFTPAGIAGKPVQAVMLAEFSWNLD